jgi:hypothetical protein
VKPASILILVLAMMMLGGDSQERITAGEAHNYCRVIMWFAYNEIMENRDKPYHPIEMQETLKALQVGIRSGHDEVARLAGKHMRSVVLAVQAEEESRKKRKGTR